MDAGGGQPATAKKAGPPRLSNKKKEKLAPEAIEKNGENQAGSAAEKGKRHVHNKTLPVSLKDERSGKGKHRPEVSNTKGSVNH